MSKWVSTVLILCDKHGFVISFVEPGTSFPQQGCTGAGSALKYALSKNPSMGDIPWLRKETPPFPNNPKVKPNFPQFLV